MLWNCLPDPGSARQRLGGAPNGKDWQEKSNAARRKARDQRVVDRKRQCIEKQCPHRDGPERSGRAAGSHSLPSRRKGKEVASLTDAPRWRGGDVNGKGTAWNSVAGALRRTGKGKAKLCGEERGICTPKDRKQRRGLRRAASARTDTAARGDGTASRGVARRRHGMDRESTVMEAQHTTRSGEGVASRRTAKAKKKQKHTTKNNKKSKGETVQWNA